MFLKFSLNWILPYQWYENSAEVVRPYWTNERGKIIEKCDAVIITRKGKEEEDIYTVRVHVRNMHWVQQNRGLELGHWQNRLRPLWKLKRTNQLTDNGTKKKKIQMQREIKCVRYIKRYSRFLTYFLILNKTFWEERIAYIPWYDTSHVSTEPLPSNDRGIFTEPLPRNDKGGYPDIQTTKWSHKPTQFFKIRKAGWKIE
jgi:hypothetical protein